MKEETARRILDLFLQENRQLFFLAQKYAPPVAMNESYAMGEIWRQNLTSASQICQNMNIEKSTLSRLLRSLKQRDLIIEKISETDRRSKYLTLSAGGEEIFSQNCHVRNLLVEEFGRNLSAVELSRFFDYVKRMADNFGAAPESVESYGSVYRHQMGRLTKAMRITSDNYLGCGIPISKFQILHLLSQAGGTRPMSDLRRELPYEASVLTRLVFAMQRAGLIEKSSAEFDRRHRHLKLSARGRVRFEQYLDTCVREFTKGLEGFKAGELQDFTVLHEKICSAGKPSGKALRAAKLSVKALRSLGELRRARAFLVREIAASRRLDNLPETLLAGENLCFAVYQSNAIKGVIEIGQVRRQWSIMHFVLAADSDAHGSGSELLRAALTSFFFRRGKCSVLAPAAGSAAAFLRKHCVDAQLPSGTIKLREKDLDQLHPGRT